MSFKKNSLFVFKKTREVIMEKQKKNIAGVVRDLLEPIASELGFMLWDVEYVKEGAEMVLRITIDKEEGIDIDDCVKMHETIDPVLDEADPIEVAYRLEVSSPGVERTISRPEHYDVCMGEKVEAKLYAPLNGQKKLTGILSAADEKTFTLDVEGEAVTLEKSACAKLSTVFEW